MLVLTLALLVSGGLAPVAQAAPTWVTPVDFAAGNQGVFESRVALDARGNAVAVWADQDAIYAATRAAGGSWSAPQRLSAGRFADAPRVALDAQGNAVAVWYDSNGSNNRVVQAATRPAGGGSVKDGWSGPQALSPTDQISYNPDVAVDGTGNAVAVWQTTNDVVRAATRPTGGGSVNDGWSPPRELSAGAGHVFRPRVATDARGDAVAVWSRHNGDGYNGDQIVAAATRPAGGGSVNDGWSAPQDLSATGRNAQVPWVALDAQGNAIVAWHHAVLAPFFDPASTVQVATRPAGGGSVNDGWSAPRDLSAAGQVAFGPQVAFDGKGNATAVWISGASSASGNVQAATRAPGGDWSAPQDVSPAQLNAQNYQLAVNPDGKAVVVWTRFEGQSGTVGDSGKYTVVAASRPPGGGWSQPQDISDSYAAQPIPAAAMDSQGNAVALWSASDPINMGKFIVKTRGYDAAGPQLRALTVPEAGAAGSALAFSVSPVDVWSAVASTSWSFGDGSSASGTSVSHTYATGGSYVVTVTSTDSLGNSSSAKRTVTVSAPGGGGGSGGLGPGAVTVPGTGGPQGGGLPAGPLGGLDAGRARGLRSCLGSVARHRRLERSRARRSVARRAKARRHMRRHAAKGRGRCLRRFGRTPGRVTGLAARRVSRSKVRLTFRAPGTAGSRAPAARGYLVKQSLRPMRSARDLRRAQTLCEGNCRFSVSRVGETVTLTVTDLRPNTTYYYAVAARDNVSGRLGRRSTVVRVRTR